MPLGPLAPASGHLVPRPGCYGARFPQWAAPDQHWIPVPDWARPEALLPPGPQPSSHQSKGGHHLPGLVGPERNQKQKALKTALTKVADILGPNGLELVWVNQAGPIGVIDDFN